MKKYIFLLGTNQDLSLAELESVFAAGKITPLSAGAVFVETKTALTPSEIIDCLGGTVKILEYLADLPKGSEVKQLEKYFIDFISEQGLDKVKLAVSEVGRDHLPKLDAMSIKRGLETYGTKVRFIDGQRSGLGAAILSHQHSVTEYYLIEAADKIISAKTLAVQDIDEWTLRDRSKPYSDRKKGMLPPKLARIMLNLAVGERILQNDNSDIRVYDAFCGSGTVLLEAALDGFSVVGTDLDVKAVLGTGENLDWLGETYSLTISSKLVTGEVSNIKADQIGGQVDYLVTEPFLGKPTPKIRDLTGIFRGLEKMYLGAFKNWTRLLKKGSTVVVVLPRVAQGGKVFDLHAFLDKIKAFGYTMSSEKSYLYSRPGAIVEREIVKLKFE
jgi:tRNA G10  N-methylase Trm11